MGSSDRGLQTKIFNYRQECTSISFNALHYRILKSGVYDGFAFTKVSDTEISVATGTFIIDDDTSKVSVKVKTEEAVSVSVTNLNIFIVLRFTWLNSLSNYVDFFAIPEADVLSTDVVLGKLNYSGATLSSVDYSYRSFGNIQDERTFLDPQANILWIDAGTNFWYISGWTIKYVNERIKDKYVINTDTGSLYNVQRTLLIYDGTDYSIVPENTENYSWNNSRLGWYGPGTSADKILAHINGDPDDSFAVTIQRIFNNQQSDFQLKSEKDIQRYLEKADSVDYTYADGVLDTATYLNAFSEVIAGGAFFYTDGVLTQYNLTIFYPADIYFIKYAYQYTYTDGVLTNMLKVTY